MFTPSPHSSPFNSFESSLSVSNRFTVLEEVESVQEPIADIEESPTLQSLNNNQFMSVDLAFQTVNSSSGSTLQKIPPGAKNNVFLVLKTNKDTKFEFPDDCGTWGRSGTTVNTTYVKTNNKLKTVVYKKETDSYCVEKKIQGKRTFVPLEPQPTPEVIVKCHRYYTKLKSDPTYQKRVTIFSTYENSTSNETIALVEYQGIYKNQKPPHGNNAKTEEPYIRTDPEILREAATITKTKHQMPIKTSHQMLLNNSVNAPSAKQIRDKVYRESKKDQNNFKVNNIADEVLSTICMCQSGENNIREVIVNPNKPPSVIVYSDDQLEDLKTNCIGSKGSVIGIDRTFNLGPCFVTTTTYKNGKLLKRETLQNPIFLGPTLLHWDGETESYYKFLCHINTRLGFPSGLKVGSDEEKAIKKAINQAFDKPTHLLCTKHLKDNVRRYLKDKEGCSTKDREFIVSSIFGHSGIVNSDDSLSYDSKLADLDSFIRKFPNFQNYLETRLKPLLQKHVFEPLQNGTVNEQWTNNNSESMNNRLKQSLDWKPHKLPDLVTKINEISSFQMNDLRRAIHGNGNYLLEDTLKHHRVPPDVWVKMSQSEKRKKTWKLLSQKPIDPEKS